MASMSLLLPDHHDAVIVDMQRLTGKHHAGRAEFLDDSRTCDLRTGRQSRTIENLGVAHAAVEIDRPAAFRLRFCTGLDGKLRQARPLDHAEARHAEIDDLDLLLGLVVVAEIAPVRGVEGVDQRIDETAIDFAVPPPAAITDILFSPYIVKSWLLEELV